MIYKGHEVPIDAVIVGVIDSLKLIRVFLEIVMSDLFKTDLKLPVRLSQRIFNHAVSEDAGPTYKCTTTNIFNTTKDPNQSRSPY